MLLIKDSFGEGKKMHLYILHRDMNTFKGLLWRSLLTSLLDHKHWWSCCLCLYWKAWLDSVVKPAGRLMIYYGQGCVCLCVVIFKMATFWTCWGSQIAGMQISQDRVTAKLKQEHHVCLCVCILPHYFRRINRCSINKNIFLNEWDIFLRNRIQRLLYVIRGYCT